MIKSIYFDLDGVLVDSCEIHYLALNKALNHHGLGIDRNTHFIKFDGLPTRIKLQKLGVDPSLYPIIWENKQKYTLDYIQDYKPDERIIFILKNLKEWGYKISVASNCIRDTLDAILEKKGFAPFIDFKVCNQDVKHPKPSPEMYLKCLINDNIASHEALIIEDSFVGQQAALASGCNLLTVQNSESLSLDKIVHKITDINLTSPIQYQNDDLTIIIPCAGAGSRFEKEGYTKPKPLIDVKGKPMIQVVIENLSIRAHYVFLVQKAFAQEFKCLVNAITPGRHCTVIELDGVTEGAACTILKAKKYIDNDNPILIVNSDQYLEWDVKDFMNQMVSNKNIDAGISTFIDTQNKWSFVKLNDKHNVIEVAEKNPISNIATTGIYYWKHGSDFCKYAQQMIEKDIRVNGEFYVCPVFNEAIKDGKIIKTSMVDKMWGLGTPEDLNHYLSEFNNLI
jgi:beta-phosphoglucomutase-like phosphatase (HAD superfamily)/dTDP-glucose pyrophosphorylase